MDRLELEATDSTPSISFDPQAGKLSICGRSIPENAAHFYHPILDWLKEYSQQPNDETQFDLYLEYINSISQKMVHEIFRIAGDLHAQDAKVNVVWHYDSDDEEMREEGQLIGTKFPFELNLKEVSEEERLTKTHLLS